MSTPHLYAAVFALIFNDKGEVLLGQRTGTEYYDGARNLPAGHVEPGEFTSQAILREIEEETGLTISPKNIRHMYTLHSIDDAKQYIDVCFHVTTWSGNPSITEPDKCTARAWFRLDNVPEYMPPADLYFIQQRQNNTSVSYSEMDLRTS